MRAYRHPFSLPYKPPVPLPTLGVWCADSIHAADATLTRSRSYFATRPKIYIATALTARQSRDASLENTIARSDEYRYQHSSNVLPVLALAVA